MTFVPTDFRSWTSFADHPIFGPDKLNIDHWSADPSQYCYTVSYTTFMPECYVHVDPAPPVAQQLLVADRDLENLKTACAQIINAYGESSHELVILDDLTVFVWLKNALFHVTIYPMLGYENCMLMLFINSPVAVDELRCDSVVDLMSHLRAHVGG